ncbi:protealysin inhibitor emfourin [Kitasatospora arboriphila]
MVRVSLERSGGFTGLRTTSSLDTDELAGPEADAALQALEAAGQAREAAAPLRRPPSRATGSPCTRPAATGRSS